MKPYTFTFDTQQGPRDHQEDRAIQFTHGGYHVFAIFDGHRGNTAADLAHSTIKGSFAAIFDNSFSTIVTTLKETVAELVNVTSGCHSGCTASIVAIHETSGWVYTATLGDSPILVHGHSGWKIGPDHNVRSNALEASNGQAKGGYLMHGYLIDPDSRDGLQMARALGNKTMNKVLSRDPELKVFHDFDTILLCSDGVVDCSHKTANAYDRVIALIESGSTAAGLNDKALEAGSRDNVTSFLIRR